MPGLRFFIGKYQPLVQGWYNAVVEFHPRNGGSSQRSLCDSIVNVAHGNVQASGVKGSMPAKWYIILVN